MWGHVSMGMTLKLPSHTGKLPRDALGQQAEGYLLIFYLLIYINFVVKLQRLERVWTGAGNINQEENHHDYIVTRAYNSKSHWSN